jgi:hypothetical protein
MVKKNSFMDKGARGLVTNKMRQMLGAVEELQQRYVGLGEFKKFSCIDIDLAVPKPKKPKGGLE